MTMAEAHGRGDAMSSGIPSRAQRPAWRPFHTTLAAAALVTLVSLPAPVARAEERSDTPTPILLAQAGDSTQGTEPRELQPRYEPVPPEPEPAYDASYIFGLTRGVTMSTMVVPVKVLLLPLSIPLDIALLPFAAIGGFF
jgi:hypothetical protein